MEYLDQEKLCISKPNKVLKGRIRLDGSKSISNRALIIQALCKDDFEIKHLSKSKDSQSMQALLEKGEGTLDVGPAGTTFRFLTSYLALKPGTQILTGSERMLKRPIGKLVDALRNLGADITYLKEEGFPPLQIGEAKVGDENEISIAANTSSQFISSLLLIAPSLSNGLKLHLSDKIVSRPYIEMTLGVMEYFGIQYSWENDLIEIKPQAYVAKDFVVEADWSAASYYYGLAALSEDCKLQLSGLFENSFQGDAAIIQIMEKLGVETIHNKEGVQLLKKKDFKMPPIFEWDFIECPDLAQSIAATLAGLGLQGLFTGLETLYIKETDRVKALQNELGKIGIYISKLPPRITGDESQQFYLLDGKPDFPEKYEVETYEDHRMAMALAILSILNPVHIEEPAVVVKSYPAFWKDLNHLGFEIK
jgi:3-phosphoshikimate 1-carboxyvinyltransferase